MLIFLLRHLRPAVFGNTASPDARAVAMAALADTDVDADLLDANDRLPAPPHRHQA